MKAMVAIAGLGLALLVGCAPLEVSNNIVLGNPPPLEATRPAVEVTREVEVTRQVEVEKVVTPDPIALAREREATSLHATTRGMAYFYSKAQGGLEQLTNIPYDNLPCKNCHTLYNKAKGQVGQSRCEACHIDDNFRAAPPQAAVSLPHFPNDDNRQSGCLACHTRQNYEITAVTSEGQPAITDVHRSPAPFGKGMTCVNCHSEIDTHGDGQTYSSQFESPSVTCENCHAFGQLPGNQPHTVHGENMNCDVCHVQTVVSCQNCHLNSILPDANGKAAEEFPYSRVTGWKFLIKRNGKIAVGNMMSIVYTQDDQARTFAVIAPFHDHSVQSLKGVDYNVFCGQCHSNPNVEEYEQTGTITISRWDERTQALVFPARETAPMIPVPKDYQTAFKLAFATISNLPEVVAAPAAEQEQTAKWEFAKDGVDLWQMLYAEPLDRLPPQIKFSFPTPTPRPR